MVAATRFHAALLQIIADPFVFTANVTTLPDVVVWNTLVDWPIPPCTHKPTGAAVFGEIIVTDGLPAAPAYAGVPNAVEFSVLPDMKIPQYDE